MSRQLSRPRKTAPRLIRLMSKRGAETPKAVQNRGARGMKRQKFKHVREEILAFLTEVGKRDDVPFDIKQKAQNLAYRVQESAVRGVGSQLSLEQQINIFLERAEADQYQIGDRAKQKIRKQWNELLGLNQPARRNRQRTK